MENYIASLSDEQKSLFGSVQKCKIGHVINSLNQFPNFIEDEMFSYVLLVAALRRKHKPISIVLIKKGCSLKCSNKTDYYETPLYYAIQLDDLDIFEMLCRRGASICDWDAKGENALELAMRLRNRRFWDFIIDQVNDDDLNPDCEEHIAIFHAACYRGDVSLIKRFIIRDFSVNSHSKSELEEWAGALPLQFAMKNRQHAHENVAFLLTFNVDFDAQDERGNTPLHSLLEIRDECLQFLDYDFVDKILTSYVLRSCNATKLHNSINICGISHFHILCSVNWDDAEHDGLLSDRLDKILEHFIKNGVDVNSSNNLKLTEEDRNLYYAGYTALHWAAQKSGLGILKLLLENGADPAKTDARGNTPLHVLDFKNPDSVEMAELLLKNGANVDVKNDQNNTPLHLAFYAQKRNDPLIRLLMSASHEVSNWVNDDGLSYLHIASSRDFGKVKILIENGASAKKCVESEGDLYGYSALHFAITFNKVDIVEYLLARGAEVNVMAGVHRRSPLHLACIEPFKYFSSPSTKNDNLCISQVSRSSKGVESNNRVKNRKDQIRIIKMLLEHGASVDARDSTGMTPLSSLCTFAYSFISGVCFDDCTSKEMVTRQKLIIDVLLHHGANLNFRGNNGKSLLHILAGEFCIDNTSRNVAEFLLSRGANVDAIDDDGCTPLHFTIEESSQFCADEAHLQKFLSSIDLLIKHGADVNARSNQLRTPLHSAVHHLYDEDEENERLLMKLLNHPDIKVDSQDQEGQTPLFEAIRLSKPCCVRKLLNAGADISIERDDGDSPISHLYGGLEDEFNGSDEGTLEICLMITEHVKKLIKLNYFVSDKVKTHFAGIVKFIKRDFSTLDSAIDKEVKKLKSIKLDNYTSLFEILRKDPNSMAKHARNKLFAEFVYSARLQSDFPLYSGFLKRQFKRGLARSLRLESAKKALQVVTETNWPDSCSEHILSYLNNADLKLLTQCSSVVDPCKSSGEVLRETRVTRAKVPRQS